MTKPYIAITTKERYENIANQSTLTVYCYQYTLSMDLYVRILARGTRTRSRSSSSHKVAPMPSLLIPQIYVPGAEFVGHYKDDRNPQHHQHKLSCNLSHNGHLIPPDRLFHITALEQEDDDLREIFLDWFNRLEAISGVKIDMVKTMLKAHKWFNGWKGDMVVKEVIE